MSFLSSTSSMFARSIASSSKAPLSVVLPRYSSTSTATKPEPGTKAETAKPKRTKRRSKKSSQNAASASPKTAEGSSKATKPSHQPGASLKPMSEKPLRTKSLTLQARQKRGVLENLVSLHHTSASFMHSPTELRTGFENAFANVGSEPYFLQYPRWRDDTIATMVDAPQIIPRPSTSESVLGKELERRQRLRKVKLSWATFKKHEDTWMRSRRGQGEPYVLSDRDKAVKEVLFGSWERRGVGMEDVQPSLDGVEEWLKAKGVSVSQYAKEWKERHMEAPVKAIEQAPTPPAETAQT